MKKKAIQVIEGNIIKYSKQDALELFKKILYSYQPGEKVTFPYYIEALYTLVDMREDKADKIGVGIDYFYIEANAWKPYVHEIRIMRLDGTVQDISIAKTVNGYYKFNDATARYGGSGVNRKVGSTDKP